MQSLRRILFATALALIVAAPLFAGWSPVGGPVQPIVTLQLDPGRPELLYARTAASEDVVYRGFYLWRSEDAGATWRDVEPGLAVPINALGIDPENPRVIWAWAAEGSLWRSPDAGGTWALRAAFPNPDSLQVLQILVDPHDPDTLYRVEIDASSSKPVVAVSRDGGTTFREGALLPDLANGARPVLVHPDRGELLAFTSTRGLLASTDGGQSWHPRGQLPRGSLSHGIRAPSSPETLYATPASGNRNQCAARSDDDGAHWRLLPYPPRLPAAHAYCYGVAIDPQDALHVWVSARVLLSNQYQNWLVESRNGGTTWAKPVVVPDPGVIAAGGERLYTGDDGGLSLFTSADGGRTWTATDRGIIAGDLRDGLVAQRPPGGGPGRRLVALNRPLSGTPDDLYRSDGGQSWVKSPFTPVTIAGAGGSIVLAGDGGNGVLRSRDGGTTWTAVPASPHGVQAFLSDPVQPRYPALLAFEPNDAYGNLALWTSDDAGATWRRSSDGLPIPCSHIASVDVCPAFPAYAVDPFNPSRRWISNYEAYPLSPRIFVTEDAGATWHLATGDLPLTLALAADPQVPARLLAGTYGGLFVSTDGGLHWAPLGDLPDGAVIRQFAWDPLSASWYAATISRGIYRSLDGGAHWTLLAGAPDHDNPTIAVDPRRPTALLAAFAGQGLWRWTP